MGFNREDIMAISRRNVLLQGCVIGAGVIAANTPGMVALAQGAPKLRRSLHGMAPDDPILSTWRDGVRLLKAANGNISWASFANIHGSDDGFHKCPHGDWYFLPWHRGFLLMYERVVRQLTGNNDFALPYWDWTLDRSLPPAFEDPTFNGQPNALFESQRDASPADSLPDSAVGQAIINQILTESPFETFGTSRPVNDQGQAQNDLDPSWVQMGGGTKGTLEGTPHDLVHGFVGGLMGDSRSARDPIFMMHHCNLDRIWWMWVQGGQADSPDPLWTDMVFQDHFFNPDGTSYSPKVSDLLTPEPLGYTYVPQTQGLVALNAPKPALAPAAMAQAEKLKSLYTVPNLTAAKAAGITAFVAANTQAATPAKYLEVPVNVDANALTSVARRPSLPSGFATLSLVDARQQYLAGPRAYAFLRDMDYADHGNTEYRVFINCDYLTAATPTSDRHYVGSFGFFGPPGSHGGHGKKPSIAVDLTQAIGRVYGSATTPPGALRVQIQPVALRPKDKYAGTATPARVEVAVVGG
jgi:tyrosinase